MATHGVETKRYGSGEPPMVGDLVSFGARKAEKLVLLVDDDGTPHDHRGTFDPSHAVLVCRHAGRGKW